MVIRIDARRMTDAAGLHAALAEALGFPDIYGRNLDALTDCLSHLDDPAARMSRVAVFPGQVLLIAVEGVDSRSREQVRSLLDVAAFVNWRRLENGEPPVVAVACHLD